MAQTEEPANMAEHDTRAHYSGVKDAVTKVEVTTNSRMATMSNREVRQGEPDYLNSFINVADCAVQCSIEVEDGSTLPPASTDNARGYKLYLTFNKLHYAPCVRLECRLFDSNSPVLPPYHTASLEFPFCSSDGKSLQEFQVSHEGVISFVSHGAYTTGFDGLAQHRTRLTGTQNGAINRLLQLSSSSPIKLTFTPIELLRGNRAKIQETIHACLRGGQELLASIDKREYSAFGGIQGISKDKAWSMRPWVLMKAGFPFVAMPSLNTFNSVREAVLRLGFSAATAHLEEELSLKLWAEVGHNTALLHIDHLEQPILAVKFNENFRRLGSVRDQKSYKLPRELHIEAKSTEWLDQHDSDSDEWHTEEGDGYVLQCRQSEISGVRGYDAFFEVLNPGGFGFLKAAKIPFTEAGQRNHTMRVQYFSPHYRSFTFTSLMETSELLSSDGARAWHTILLNQGKDSLEMKDATADVRATSVSIADQWMLSWRPWNVEQRAVLSVVHGMKGGMAIVKGIAGTGKTLLQSALCLYFGRLGFKVLVTPPSNSNATHSAIGVAEAVQAEDVAKIEPPRSPAVNEGRSTPLSDGLTLCRVFASSLGNGAHRTTKGQAPYAQPFHANRASSTLRSLLHTLKGRSDTAETRRLYDIEHRVIAEADKGEFKYVLTRNDHTAPSSSHLPRKRPIDSWDVLRDFIRMAQDPDVDIERVISKDREWYKSIYDQCKTQMLAATDILITTTGNARCAEVLGAWLDPSNDFKVPCKGVIVMCDEAFKDTELATWNAICAAGQQVKGVFMFGDDMQRKPVNTTSSGGAVFGQFNQQLDVALPARLILEGFPYIELLEQSRMDPSISHFANQQFYQGKLRDSERAVEPLDDRLKKHLLSIVAQSFDFRTEDDRNNYVQNASDEQARHHYIEVRGKRTTMRKNSKSVCVKEHVDVFFEKIFPKLQEYWGHETSKHVMIICAYSAAKHLYNDKIEELRKTQKLPASLQPLNAATSGAGSAAITSAPSTGRRGAAGAQQTKVYHPETLYPRVETIDGSQGQESFMVIMDGSFQFADAIGFMEDRGRCNVSLTRAKGVLWIIGGVLNTHRPGPASPYSKLKAEMETLGRVHKFRTKAQAAAARERERSEGSSLLLRLARM